MYSWIWRHLPGNTVSRAAISLVLALVIVFLLFQYVFPLLEPLLPLNNATLEGGAD